MGMPSVTISFSETAVSAIKHGDRGIIAMIVKDTVPSTNPIVVTSETDIPSTLSADNQKQISLALIGYQNPPKKVIVYVLASTAEDYTDALDYFESVKWDYMVAPTVATDKQEDAIVSYIKENRENGKLVKAVLPNKAADNEGIINFTTASVTDTDGVTYTTEKYCARIAGLIAGTPINSSATYAPLAELADCAHLSKEDMDAAVDNGEFIVFFDGEKVKTGRAVNSFKTTTAAKGESFKKIKIVDAMDMISTDIRTTAEDSYLGKYPNTFNNKCLLMSAIGIYFDSMISAGVLNEATVDIDSAANADYLKLHGKDVSEMTDDEIRRANTGSYVYLTATVSILDAIEDIVLPITI